MIIALEGVTVFMPETSDEESVMSKYASRSLSRFRYQLEKGNPHLLLLAALALGLLVIVLLLGVSLHVAGKFQTLTESMWWSFLNLSDSGYLGDSRDPALRTVGLFLWAIGVICVTSFLTAVVTNLVAARLAKLRHQGFNIPFEKHTVIVGWNAKIFTLVEEIFRGNPLAGVAILGPLPKEEAELQLEKRVFSRLDDPNGKTRRDQDPRRRVVYRNGNARIPKDLERIAARGASSFVILADENERGLAAHVTTLQTYLAVQRFRRRKKKNSSQPVTGKRAEAKVSTIVEITDDRFRAHTFLAGGHNPRMDTWVEQDRTDGKVLSDLPRPKEPPTDENLCLVNVDELVSRAIVQCAVQPRLSKVLEELLSFEGKEFFVTKPEGGHWKRIVDEAKSLPVDRLPALLAAVVKEGLVCGVYGGAPGEPHAPHFCPKMLHEHLGDWPLIVLGSVDDYRKEGREPQLETLSTARRFEVAGVRPRTIEKETQHYRVLLLGHNRRVPVLVEQFAAYTEQYKELDLHLTFVSPEINRADVLAQVRAEAQTVKHLREDHVVVLQKDYSDWRVLGDLLKVTRSEKLDGTTIPPSRSFECIVLLAEDCDTGEDRVDARVILGVVMLRAFRGDPDWRKHLKDMNVVAELLDPQNVEVIEHDDWIADVIVSNQFVSRFIAQVSMDHRLQQIHRELLDYGGREIYERDANEYVSNEGPNARTFLQAMASAAHREEIALGVSKAPKQGKSGGPTICLGPSPKTPIEKTDRLIVVAKD